MDQRGIRPMHNYTEDALKGALFDIRHNNNSILGASKKYGVPRSTIQDRLSGRVPEGPRRMGPQTVLSTLEEDRLVKWCEDLAKCGFPLKCDDLLNTVQSIVKEDNRSTPFLNGRPGRKWFSGFLKRHPRLAIRESEGISKGRAVVTEQVIRKWFAGVREFLSEQNALDILDDPTRIFNGDETSFSLCPKTGTVIAPRGYRNVYSIQKGNEKETITVLLVFSASGKTLQPMVVFPYMRPPKNVISSVPDNWFLGKSESGWMVSETFFEYIANGVHTWLNENNVKKPILLFVDGHKSHMSFQLSQFCEENGIILYALPPNTTHMLQPADVSVFRPLKVEWRKTVREWQIKPENSNKVLTKSTFCPLLNMVLSKMSLEDTIRNGFRKCGLYPFDCDNVDFTKCVKNQLELLEANQKEITNNSLKEDNFDLATETIKLIAPKLHERGVDVNIIMEEINNLKQRKRDQTIEILENVTIESGTYIINADGVLEKQVTSPILDEENIIEMRNLSPCPSPNLSTTTFNSELFKPIDCSSPKVVANTDCLSPSSSTTIARNKNSFFKSLGCSPTGSIIKKTNCISPTFEKHLYYPQPSTSSRITLKPRAPSAISALAWRTHMQSKDREKSAKAAEVKKRKLDRQKRKLEKDNKAKKGKKGKKKQTCGECKEDLDTDAEDDGLKNVGCDKCPEWFHLKCTNLKEFAYDLITEVDFVCKTCNDITET